MAAYEVISREKYETKYYIEADSLEKALEKLRKGKTELMVQKQVCEAVRCGRQTDYTEEEWLAKCNKVGYF